jgi:hypothetical protein
LQAVVQFFRRQDRACESDHEQFQPNDEGLIAPDANVELSPPTGATHVRIEITNLDEYGLPPADMTGTTIVYYRQKYNDNNEVYWDQLESFHHVKGEYDPEKHAHYDTLSRLVAILRVVLMAAKKNPAKISQPPRFFKKPQPNPFSGLQPSKDLSGNAEPEISEEEYQLGVEEIAKLKRKELQDWQFETLDYTQNP